MSGEDLAATQEAHETINHVLAECLELATSRGVGITVLVTAPVAGSGMVRMGMDTNIEEDGSGVALDHLARMHGALCGKYAAMAGGSAISLSMHAFSDGMSKSTQVFSRGACDDLKAGAK